MNHHQHIGGRFLRYNANSLDFFGQARQRAGYPVLHLNLRHIRIGSLFEGDRDNHATINGHLGIHIQHAVNAVDHLFQRRGYRIGNHLRVSAGVAGANLYRGRRNGRIFTQRQF